MEPKQTYIAPPKLGSKLLLARLSVSELCCIVAIFFVGVFQGNIINAIYWSGLFAVFCARLFGDRSFKDILMVLFKYHTTPQFFSTHFHAKRRNKKQ